MKKCYLKLRYNHLEYFFQGVGKGVVGLVARPTGGIIDFASGTFDSVKRATEVVAEVNRARPPRFLKQVFCEVLILFNRLLRVFSLHILGWCCEVLQ